MEELLKEYLKNNLVDGSYNLVLDPKNQTSFIQFRCTLNKSLLEGLNSILSNYTICSTYKTSSDARKNYTLIVFFNLI